MGSLLRLEIDGRHPDPEGLWTVAHGFGHFTAMQVRGGKTRGLDLHFQRLAAANRELFDAAFDPERVRGLVRHALAGLEDASVRVYVFESDSEPRLLITVRPPGGVASPQRLQSVTYQRPQAHLKHLATEQGFHLRAARRSGFDDAVLASTDGTVSETAITNIGVFDDAGVVWPDAPLLRGITMQLLERSAPSRTARIRLGDLPSYEGVFLSNARGIAAVSEVDGMTLPQPSGRLAELVAAYDSVPWDPI